MASYAFTGKVALVTGAGTGLGRAAALAFARNGAIVVVADIHEAQGAETSQQIHAAGGESKFLKVDVSSATQVAEMVRETVASYKQIDFAFNNAGILGKISRLADYSEDEWDHVVDVNLKGIWLSMKYELQQMVLQQYGAIVNTSSIAGLVGFQHCSAHVASGHGIIGLTKTAALEYADDGIRVNAICPGAMHTAMLAELYGHGDVEVGERLVQERIDFGRRIASPEQVAETVVWLCSDAASFVTGHALPVDGGFTAQ